ncbi:MAG: multidrug MFS transporter [Halieaceae bacterium]|nr:multidrug MFS transporter [Halieaceae bacterium]|tara:strand:+ start:9964 stop:11118 length:1155 start_codon:yes stop_codon:yes gene_type:complete
MGNITYTKIDIPEEQISDLYRRLSDTRWPASPAGPAWEYGTSRVYLREVVDYWLNQFNWRENEAFLNQYTHVLAPYEGRLVHAVVVKAEESRRPPLVCAHGWPGSFIEFLEVAERLAHPEKFGGIPEDGMDVVIVSLPGCGLSSTPVKPISPREIAREWVYLAQSLGFQEFFIHGSDWGAAIASWLALDSPNTILGAHLTSAIIQPNLNDHSRLSQDEKAFLKARSERPPWDTGYRIMQGTKPLTLSYALTDSPVGLAAWLLEKFQHWTESRGSDTGPVIGLDSLLTIISLYWFAGPGPASWIYRFLIDGTALVFDEGVKVTVPTSICNFKHDISPLSPPEWQNRCYNVVQRTKIDHGGHFPGLDAPVALSENIRSFTENIVRG